MIWSVKLSAKRKGEVGGAGRVSGRAANLLNLIIMTLTVLAVAESSISAGVSDGFAERPSIQAALRRGELVLAFATDHPDDYEDSSSAAFVREALDTAALRRDFVARLNRTAGSDWMPRVVEPKFGHIKAYEVIPADIARRVLEMLERDERSDVDGRVHLPSMPS